MYNRFGQVHFFQTELFQEFYRTVQLLLLLLLFLCELLYLRPLIFADNNKYKNARQYSRITSIIIMKKLGTVFCQYNIIILSKPKFNNNYVVMIIETKFYVNRYLR